MNRWKIHIFFFCFQSTRPYTTLTLSQPAVLPSILPPKLKVETTSRYRVNDGFAIPNFAWAGHLSIFLETRPVFIKCRAFNPFAEFENPTLTVFVRWHMRSEITACIETLRPLPIPRILCEHHKVEIFFSKS